MSDIFGRLGPSPEMMNPEPAGPLQLDSRGARWLRRRLAGGVVAVTVAVDSGYRAATVSACAVVSVEPLQFLVSLERDSQMEAWVEEAGAFGLSLLTWKQQSLADRFAGFAPLVHATFRDIAHFTAQTGSPLIEGCLGWADCSLIDALVTGDHHCFIGQAVAVGRGSGEADEPLVYFLNRYHRLA